MDGPQFRLDGRVALITGSGRGIGLAIGQAFAAHGCAVALHDIELPVAEREAQELRDQGHRAVALGGDITDLSVTRTLIEQTVQQLGGLHILVNNAAVQRAGDWSAVPIEELEWTFRGNQMAPLILCQLAAPIFKAQRWGRIINIGSVQEKGGFTFMLPYSMSKAALKHMTIALARDFAASNVTVNMIGPGWFNTHRNRDEFPDQRAVAEAGRSVPAGRVGAPIDCAGAALLLASESGDYITGQTIYVDGGLTVHRG
jgi:NAD(P)-dependent dehydrogenase (short-subunit alcohol dehydrogenase family)